MGRGSDLTVVVVTWQGAHLLPECLAFMAAETLPHDLVVVDNASTDAPLTCSPAAGPPELGLSWEQPVLYLSGRQSRHSQTIERVLLPRDGADLDVSDGRDRTAGQLFSCCRNGQGMLHSACDHNVRDR